MLFTIQIFYYSCFHGSYNFTTSNIYFAFEYSNWGKNFNQSLRHKFYASLIRYSVELFCEITFSKIHDFFFEIHMNIFFGFMDEFIAYHSIV